MTKRYVGTTLTYDVRAKTYLRTEVYQSDDPGETVELRIIEPDSDETPKTATRAEKLSRQHDEYRTEPILLRAEDRKFEHEPPRHKRERSKRRNTRVLSSQRVKPSANGRPKMVVSDRSGPSEDNEHRTPPPVAERTLDGIPFVRREND
ncbi:MAG: hypothetical protein ACLFVJ_20945 [Persicimonas sp.]